MMLLDTHLCYILDAILLLYGFILTAMYCQLRFQTQKDEPRKPKKQAPEKGIYAGLTSPNNDTYETIHVDKKPIV